MDKPQVVDKRLVHGTGPAMGSIPNPDPNTTPFSRSLAVLGLDPLPPKNAPEPSPWMPRRRRAQYPRLDLEYTSGVIMAARRIEAVLPTPLQHTLPLQPKRGWTDGSQAWRAYTYSYTHAPRTPADILDPGRAAYTTCVSFAERSAKAQKNKKKETPATQPVDPTPHPPPPPLSFCRTRETQFCCGIPSSLGHPPSPAVTADPPLPFVSSRIPVRRRPACSSAFPMAPDDLEDAASDAEEAAYVRELAENALVPFHVQAHRKRLELQTYP
ncbi:hypothetical protein B0H17DRAFT_1123954 [Mycena rosella]|uniref:Uncharacterized protein n=1 Tax=Mycena rosella TaxID=1033263 RepID=A0AAD7H3D9_MYCRO|nr:hypothetical protein B0H17DRAFT_1123954 [Mycena rosella]